MNWRAHHYPLHKLILLVLCNHPGQCFFYEDRTKQQFNLNGAASSLSPHHHICLCGPYATLHPLHLQRPAERWDLTFDRQIALSATLTVEEHGVMCKNSCHDYIDIISGKQKWGLLDRGSVQIPTVRTHWLEIMREKKKKGFELVQDNVCIISIADDRDDSHAVALSIQYSWKCDTFPFQKDGTQSKTFFFFFFLSTSTGCSFQSIIEFPKKSIWLRGHGHAARCLRQDGSKYAERSGLRGMPVLLSLMPLCSVLLADSWHGTRHAQHNPSTWSRIEEQNSI